MDKCKSCGAAIVWARTEKGRSMPVDAEPAPDGNLYLYTFEGKRRVRVILDDEPHARERHTSHFATCSHTERHRQPKG